MKQIAAEIKRMLKVTRFQGKRVLYNSDLSSVQSGFDVRLYDASKDIVKGKCEISGL